MWWKKTCCRSHRGKGRKKEINKKCSKTASRRRREKTQNKLNKKSALPESSFFSAVFPNKAVQVWQKFTVHWSLCSYAGSDRLSQAKQFAFYIKRALRQSFCNLKTISSAALCEIKGLYFLQPQKWWCLMVCQSNSYKRFSSMEIKNCFWQYAFLTLTWKLRWPPPSIFGWTTLLRAHRCHVGPRGAGFNPLF